MTRGAIVVGAGPTGLALAGELGLAGVDVVVYDKLPAPTGETRAAGFTRRTAELLDQRGVLERYGAVMWGRQVHYGGVRLDLGRLEQEHTGVAGLPQGRTEAGLQGWLDDLGVEVRRGYELVGLRQTADEAGLELDGPDGRVEDTARYVVGCDGAHSTVRRLAGIDFPGEPAARSSWMADVAGVELKVRPMGERTEGGMALSIPFGRSGVSRIVLNEPEPPPDRALTFTEIAERWERRTGESLAGAEPRWTAVLGDATGLAAEYRRGRVLLAGDAAHDHGPLGAIGLSAGVQDAMNLGWKLAATLAGWAPDGLLDTYHSERHAVGADLLRDVRAQGLLYLGGPELAPMRSVTEDLARIPAVADHLASRVSGLYIRYDVGAEGHPLLGMRMPDRELEPAAGGKVRLYELLRAARGVLVVTAPPPGGGADAAGGPDQAGGADAAGGWAALAGGWADRVDVVTGRWVPAGPDPAPDAVLLRPDGYVAWAAPGGGDLPAALRTWFGAPAG